MTAEVDISPTGLANLHVANHDDYIYLTLSPERALTLIGGWQDYRLFTIEGVVVA